MPLKRALAILDGQWDDLFRYHDPEYPARNGSQAAC